MAFGLTSFFVQPLAPYYVNVNAVCPTTVDTGMVNNEAFFEYFAGDPGPNATREYMIAHMNELNLFADRGLLAPDDVSAVMLWLASEEARHITGYALPVDAGFLMR